MNFHAQTNRNECSNWHWESKNFNKIAEDSVRSRLLSIVADDGKYAVRIIEVPKLKAEASVNIRKGKKIPMFDVTFTAKWEGRSILGAAKVSTGEVHVVDLMPDDIDEDFPVRVVVGQGSGTSVEVDVVSKLLASTVMTTKVRRHMREFAGQLHTLDGGPEALVVDAQRRAEERTKTEEALLLKAAEKDKIAREQSAKEKARKDQQKPEPQAGGAAGSGSVKAAAAASSAPPTAAAAAPSPLAATAATLSTNNSTSSLQSKPASSSSNAAAATGSSSSAAAVPLAGAVVHSVNLEGKVASAGQAPAAKASVWNSGAWQWEQKEFMPWARARLNELLAGIDVDIPGGHIKVVEVEGVNGDATINIRKGRKIVVFDLAITARWEGQLLDGDGRLAGTGDGDIVITGLDQDSTSTDYSLKIKPSEDGGINDRQLARLMDKWGSPVVRKKVWQFVEELRAKE